MVKIHPTAIVDPRVKFAGAAEIGPYVILEGHVEIGKDCVFFPFSVVGVAPQDKRWKGEPTRVVIGDRNVVREHVTIHRGTGSAGSQSTDPNTVTAGVTKIGDDNLLMVGCHVAHDVTIGSQCTIANAVQLAGHVTVADYVNFGGMSGAAQFVHIGESAFVAAGSMCERDVPPFVIVQGDRARVRALNVVGLERRGIPGASIEELERVFRGIFGGKEPRSVAVKKIVTDDPYALQLLAALARRRE